MRQNKSSFSAGIFTASSFLLLPKCPVCAGALLSAAGMALPVDGLLLGFVAVALLVVSLLLFAVALRNGMGLFWGFFAVVPGGALLAGVRWAPGAVWPGAAVALLAVAAVMWRRWGRCSCGHGCARGE